MLDWIAHRKTSAHVSETRQLGKEWPSGAYLLDDNRELDLGDMLVYVFCQRLDIDRLPHRSSHVVDIRTCELSGG